MLLLLSSQSFSQLILFWRKIIKRARGVTVLKTANVSFETEAINFVKRQLKTIKNKFLNQKLCSSSEDNGGHSVTRCLPHLMTRILTVKMYLNDVK